MAIRHGPITQNAALGSRTRTRIKMDSGDQQGLEEIKLQGTSENWSKTKSENKSENKTEREQK